MKNKETKKTKAEIQEKIMTAAWKRFGYFGYTKTTMAEIAGDCSMSAANLYRYFKDKSAIGAEVAARYFDRETILFREVAERGDMDAAEKLSEMVRVSVRYNFSEFEDSPAIMDLVNHICTVARHLIDNHRQESAAIVAEILAEGNRTGAFHVENIEETALAIRFATIPFHATPVFLMLKQMGRTREELEEMATRVVGLLVNGISRE